MSEPTDIDDFWPTEELFEGDEVEVSESQAPDTTACPHCGETMQQSSEPVGVFSVPPRWRWTCSDCDHSEVR